MASVEHTPEERQRAIEYVRRALSVGRDTEPDPEVVAATAEKVLRATPPRSVTLEELQKEEECQAA